MSDHVRVTNEGGVVHVRLDKPAKRNALDDAMIATLLDVVEAAGHDDTARVIRISGEGDHFCGGFDIVGRNAADAQKPRTGAIQRRLPAQAHRLVPLLVTVQVPVVCEVRGWAAGIGLHIAAASDFVVVAEDARLWEPFTERGFTPDSGGTWLLPRLVGTVRAREMLLLGRALTGTEAVEWGLASRAVPAGALTDTVDALVDQLASGPTVALGLTKWLLHAGAEAPLEQHLRDEAFALELSSRTSDFREGVQAFVEKRAPKFEGR